MIHVEGHDVKCGKANGPTLIEEAGNAVIAVIETLAHEAPEGISREDITLFVLRHLGHQIGHFQAHGVDDITACEEMSKENESRDDFLNRLFGDLLDKEE